MIPENSTTVDYGLIINATEYAEMTGLNSGAGFGKQREALRNTKSVAKRTFVPKRQRPKPFLSEPCSGEKRALPVTDEEASGIDGMMVFGFIAMALADVIIVVGVSLYVNKVRRKPESSCTNVEASSRVLAN